MAGTQQGGARLVDEYLAGCPQPHRETLTRLRATLRTVLPHADEAIKYGMPAVVLHGVGVAGYAAFKEHCSYFPMSSAVLTAAGSAIERYPTSKGGLRFPVDTPLPTAVVRRLVKLRLAEIAAVEDGVRREYFPDGALKAEGKMKAGQLHGAWRWFRQDGTFSRTGRFAHGKPVGTWETWDRSGALVRRTKR